MRECRTGGGCAYARYEGASEKGAECGGEGAPYDEGVGRTLLAFLKAGSGARLAY